MAFHTETGKKGERIAAEYIQKLGYRILETNWRSRRAEIDIIALDQDELVIVEVKSRTGEQFGHPADAVNQKKMDHLIAAAERYIRRNQIGLNTRFDLIAIIFENNRHRLEHIKNAFYPLAR
ncbi:MAG: YraN family protein [Mangrovibacterium sp.]